MKTTKTLLIIALLLSMGIYAHAQTEAGGFLATGNALLEVWKGFAKWHETTDGTVDRVTSYKAGAFAGFVEGVSTMAFVKGLYNPPDGVTYLQTFMIVGKYLENHPEKLHLLSFVLVIEALQEAFPPSKRTK